jgi:hypothetical protein
MKTKVQILKDNPELKTIINAVINRIGLGSVEDVNNHGIYGGFNGFIYFSDTHKFAMKHRKTIVDMLERMADDYGEDVVTMVSGFSMFRNAPMDADDKKDLYRYLGGGRCEQGTITNLMAWYAAEEVCCLFED